MEIQIVNHLRNQLGEGPVWDAETQTLYWVDIEGKCVYAKTPAGALLTYQTPEEIGCFVLREGQMAVAAMQTGIYQMNLADGTFSLLCHPLQGGKADRYNDGKVSPDGKFYIGTMGETGTGALYCVEPAGNWRVVREGVTISNGLAWDEKRGKMYYIDTPARVIYAYQYGPKGPCGEEICVRVAPENGMPDGMTIDTDGNLWVAHWGGGMLGQYDPQTGELIGKIELPAKYITSATFAGPRLDELYITSAKSDDPSPQAGALFHVKNSGAKGAASRRFV